MNNYVACNFGGKQRDDFDRACIAHCEKSFLKTTEVTMGVAKVIHCAKAQSCNQISLLGEIFKEPVI